MRKWIAILTLCIFVLTIFAGCGFLQKLGLQKGAEDELRPVSSIALDEEEAEALSNKLPVYLYFANEDNSRLKLEVRYISMEDAKKGTAELAGLIVNELIKGPASTSGYRATIPEGTKLKSVKVKDGVATVDLSKEFKSAHPGGKDAEKMTIYSIVNSLTELKDIQQVKFTIAGKTLKEYMGSFQFDQAFPRSAGLIGKDAVTPGSSSKADKKKDKSKVKTSPTPSPSASPKATASPEKKSDSGTDSEDGDSLDTSGDGNGDSTETSGESSEEFELLE